MDVEGECTPLVPLLDTQRSPSSLSILWVRSGEEERANRLASLRLLYTT